MQRRNFVTGAAGASLLSTMQAQTQSPATLELRYFKLRNTSDNQRAKLADYLAKAAVPAMKKAGAGTIGLFASSIGPDAPFILLLAEHASLAAFEQCYEKLRGDQAFQAASLALQQSVALPYQRMEVQLLRGFPGFPKVEVPAGGAGRPARLFELRTYESNTPISLEKKIGMFESGEIAIFRKCGLLPVFFGATVAGGHMPNLTYMVAYDSIVARDNAWRTFSGDPDWAKLRATPGLSDAETVSNITNMLLTPMAGSDIR